MPLSDSLARCHLLDPSYLRHRSMHHQFDPSSKPRVPFALGDDILVPDHIEGLAEAHHMLSHRLLQIILQLLRQLPRTSPEPPHQIAEKLGFGQFGTYNPLSSLVATPAYHRVSGC